MDEIIKMTFIPDLVNQHTRVVYFFDKQNPRGGVTVAYAPVLHDSKGNPAGKFAEVAVAYCHPDETFCRAEGKMVAMENLNNGRSILMPIYKSKHPVRLLRDMFWF